MAEKPTWARVDFPALEDAETDPVHVRKALLSRADSGRIFWNLDSPRSYVRGAVYENGGRLVDTSQRPGGTGADLVLTVNPPFISPEERADALELVRSGSWLYLGHWMQGFGHFIVETIPMLWALKTMPDVRFDGVVAHRFTSRRRFDWQNEFVVRLLDGLQIDVVDSRPACYEHLYVGGRAYKYQRAISRRAVDAWDAIAESVDGTNPRPPLKVFFSRTAFSRDQPSGARGYRNTAAVDDLFRERGFAVVFPEELSVTEQIQVARDAHYIAGPGGSALHLAAFARGAHVIELGDTRSRDHLVATQRAIAAVKRQPIAHIPYGEAADGGLDLSALEQSLDSLGV